jgi:RHS repeat-associated protein
MDEGQDPNDRSRPDDPDFNPDPRQRPDPNEPRDPNNPNDPNDPANRDGREDEDHTPDDCGSVIECYNQILGEDVSLVGTDQALHYRSDRVPGRNASYFLKVRLTAATVPAGLKRVDLEISIAGQLIQKEFSPLPLQEFSMTWDGLDAYGRPVQGKQRVTIRKSYIYPLVYKQPADFRQSWSAFAVADYAVQTTRLAGEFAIVRERQGPVDGMAKVIGGWDQREVGLGGWSLSSHHVFDPAGRELYLGGGDRRSARQIGPVSFVAAGTGLAGYAGDGGRAVAAQLANPHDVAVGPDGTLYVADTENQVVRKISRDGVITRIAGIPGEVCQVEAGNSFGLQCGNGGPALAAHLFFPSGISVAPDGSVYVADTGDHCVRRIAGGRIDTAAGQCRGFDPDGNGKRQVQGVPEKLSTDCLAGCDAIEDLTLIAPQDVEVAPDGGFYVVDSSARVVVYVSPRGFARIVAGPGVAEQPERGDGGPALEATLIAPQGIAIGHNGEIYVADAFDQRVRRIDRDGTISTVAGTGEPGLSGDGEIGAEAQLDTPVRVAVSRDGSLYITDRGNGRIRRVSESGILSTIMGSEDNFELGRGGPAQGVRLSAAFGLAAAPDGSLYVTDGSLVYRTGTALKGFTGDETVIPSEEGGEVYVFDPAGRHLRTQSALTGAVREQFRYDAAGRLSEIENADGLVTRIEHDPQGGPTAIVSPFGQRTLLTVDAHGYLATVTNPAGEKISLTNGPGGLLESFTDPRGNASHFAYDSLGRLTLDADAAGGSMSLERFRVFDDYGVFQQTPEGRSKGRMVSRFWNGDVLHTNTDSRSGTMTRAETQAGRARDTGPGGTVSESVSGGDPVWGFVAPVEATSTTRTPSGLALSSTTRTTAGLADIEDPLSLTFRRIETTVNGRAFTTDYDALSRRTTSTSAEGRQSFSLHDSHGRVVEAGVTGLASAKVSYDPQGRPVSVAQGTGDGERRTRLEYDAAGFLARVTDPLGRTLSLERDPAGRVLRQVLPDGRELRFAYDAAGNVISVTPPGRPPHTFTFTPVDLTSGYTPPALGLSSSATTYTYDRDRRATSVARPGGQTVSFAYETTGRLHSLGFSRGSLTYTYSLSGSDQLRRIEAPEGVQLDYTYDGFLPIRTTWSGPIAGSVERVYDNNFRVTELRVDGIGVQFRYDRDGLLRQAGTLSFLRSPDNGLLTGTQVGAVTTAMTYTEFGEPATMMASLDGAPVYSAAYSRDALGRITEKQENVEGTPSTFDYSYDEAGRLTEVKRDGTSISSLAYDTNSNRTSRTTPQGTITATYDDQDRLLTHGDLAFTYTSNGELASKSQNGHTVTYDFDELGNLRTVVLDDGTRIDYLIDGQNRRIGKKVNGVLGQAFLYQSTLNPAAQLDGAGTIVARFVYGTRANVPDLILKEGRTYRVLADHLGSPRLIVDTETGDIAQRLDYDEWGKVTLNTNPGFQPFGFAGGLYDPQTGFVRFGARDYDPEIGRWTAKDPILFAAQEPNLYGYALADPVNFLDPDGLAGKCPDVPLAPSGVNIDKNMKEAAKQTFPFDLFWFRDQVDYGAPWDFKTRGDKYQDFGNFHYGAVGTAAGIPETILLREAGRAQVSHHRPDGKGDPGSIFNPWGGTPPYGDDPRDQEWIKKGIEYCKCKSGH